MAKSWEKKVLSQIMATKMPFGKYRKKTFQEIVNTEVAYLHWMIRRLQPHDYLYLKLYVACNAFPLTGLTLPVTHTTIESTEQPIKEIQT